MKTVCIFIATLTASFLLAWIFPEFLIPENLANTLYTITGIMFSIGLSLTVASSTSGIRNKEIKNKIRGNIKSVRNSFISVFLVASIIFILYIILPDFQFPFFNTGWILLLVQTVAIVFFIVNFINIQHFNEEIEDAVNR